MTGAPQVQRHFNEGIQLKVSANTVTRGQAQKYPVKVGRSSLVHQTPGNNLVPKLPNSETFSKTSSSNTVLRVLFDVIWTSPCSQTPKQALPSLR